MLPAPTIITLPICTVFSVRQPYSFPSALFLMHHLLPKMKTGAVDAVALPVDPGTQAILAKAFLEQSKLSNTCDGDRLVGMKSSAPVLFGRRDMGFLHLLVALASAHSVPCFAVRHARLSSEDAATATAALLHKLHERFDRLICISTPRDAKRLAERLGPS
ncbi:MAG: hypothetical protein NTW87_12080 [Planctomycetota bacterium]|nr:hypothetical protein [Planctomycetota bacterium]